MAAPPGIGAQPRRRRGRPLRVRRRSPHPKRFTAHAAFLTALLGAGRAAAEAAPYEPWRGAQHPPPPPLAPAPRRDPGPAPREWARRAGELGLRGLVEARGGVAGAARPASSPSPAGVAELVGLARVRPRGGLGLAAAIAWDLAGDAARAIHSERLSLLWRAAGQEDGAFDPYAELLVGVTRLETAPGSDHAAIWGSDTRVGGGLGWQLDRSLRVGVAVAFGTTLLAGRTAAVTPVGSRPWRIVPSLGAGLELTLCLGRAH